jgi:GTP-binding protein HflX
LIDNTINLITEKALLVGVVLPHTSHWEVDDNLEELRLLAETAGVDIVDKLVQDREKINSAYFIGSGKVDELARLVKATDASSVIFDSDLTPAQIRNLENATGAKIIDRSTLILDIFAKHARTREAKTQVESAQLQYLLPHLTRQWGHLSRQVGGIGTKGPGETQLETDRRLVRNRIEVLRKELKKIDQQRSIRRKGRENKFRVSLVGYTNVGKSTIMNLLSGSDVLVEDQLFATLDSTTRKVRLNEQHDILLSDTVGFIRKLPHHLVASFKSTLDEVRNADLLLHVVDISHPAFQEQIPTVLQVLEEMKLTEIPILTVFNKIDLLKENNLIASLRNEFSHSVFISAARHIRTERLKEAIVNFIELKFVETEVDIPMDNQSLVNFIYSNTIVKKQIYENDHIVIKFKSSAPVRDKIVRTISDWSHHQKNDSHIN